MEDRREENLDPESSGGAAGGPRILTVSEVTDRLKGLLGGLGRISVEGEVASLARPASGHVYFNLKDRRRGIESVLGCAVWRSQVSRAMRSPLEEGVQVIAHGKLDVYAPRGSYSLIVDRIEPRGLGALLVQLEELKRELAGKGWFDRARPLPLLPKTIGVATSRDGAAFADFLRTRSLRWPCYPVRLAHTPVQGAGASREIAGAIAALDRSGVDVIVVCRGGGSLEDLWAFNERPVAEAIRAARVPVVSGVGHQTDQTLADLVADHRAHTPTDAAQTVIPLRAELEEKLDRQFNYLLAALDDLFVRREERLERLEGARVLRGADWILERRGEVLDLAGERLARGVRLAVERAGERVAPHQPESPPRELKQPTRHRQVGPAGPATEHRERKRLTSRDVVHTGVFRPKGQAHRSGEVLVREQRTQGVEPGGSQPRPRAAGEGGVQVHVAAGRDDGRRAQ